MPTAAPISISLMTRPAMIALGLRGGERIDDGGHQRQRNDDRDGRPRKPVKPRRVNAGVTITRPSARAAAIAAAIRYG